MNAGTTNKNSGKTVKVRQVGSPLRREHTQRETLIGLKLNKISPTWPNCADKQAQTRGIITKSRICAHEWIRK